GRFLATQDERLSVLPRRQAELLLPDRSAAGRIRIHGRDYLYATRTSGPDAVILLRTATSVGSDSRPFWFALAATGALGCLVAAALAALLARGIARPVARVARASSRLAAGESPQPVALAGARELRELARSFNTMAGQLARARGVQLRLEESSAALAEGDPDRLLQALSNLVENALRCTPPGGTVTLTPAAGRLTVTDSGPGIAREEVPRAFERFFLYRRHNGDRAVGTGLGLAIVRELAQAMGGDVEVASSHGAGAAFTIRLPLPRPASRSNAR